MDAVAPPKEHRRSGFIRQALAAYLSLPTQPLAERPHLRDRPELRYHTFLASVSDDQIHELRAKYPDVSVSVVAQAAVKKALEKAERPRRARQKTPQSAAAERPSIPNSERIS